MSDIVAYRGIKSSYIDFSYLSMVPSSKVILDSGFVTTWVSADGGAQISITLPPTFALAK